MKWTTKRLEGVLLIALAAMAIKAIGCSAAPEETDQITEDLSRRVCRGPELPGCGTCCRQTPDGCTVQSYSGLSHASVIPWYNVLTFSPGSCPSGCAECAACTSKDERDFEAMGRRPDCDCSTQRIGVDPCFLPRSCGCYCSRVNRILKACPHLAGTRSEDVNP